MWDMGKQRLKLNLVLASTAIIFVIVWFGFRKNGMDERLTVSKQRKRPVDTASLTLSDTSLKKLLSEDKLQPFKSRGATLFMDNEGNIRVPPAYILDMMELRDLEEAYHRYIESIQTICKHQVHLGNVFDGGYDICEDLSVAPTQPCLVYSFGVRDDFSFDEELTRLYGCTVHSFDPANGMTDHKHSENIYFHSIGLDGEDGIKNGNWKMRTISSKKKELGHSNKDIEIMKIDIEGGEWPAFPNMISSGALSGVKQLIMEFHSWVNNLVEGRNKQDYRTFLNILRQLYEEGFRIFFFKRFPDKSCLYTDDFNIDRTGCHEVHLMRVKK